MNQARTPETDRQAICVKDLSDHGEGAPDVIVDVKFARSLEMQRDALREALRFVLADIETAMRMSAIYNGHTHSFQQSVAKARAALQPKEDK